MTGPGDTSGTSLVRRGLLARNTLLNLLGHGAPLVVAILAIPPLIEGIGTARFGVLTLAWVVIGYFGLLDLGVGRSLTQIVAERWGEGRRDSVAALAGTALTLLAAVGVAGGTVLFLLAPWLAADALNIPEHLLDESLASFRLLALSIPMVTTTAGLRGLLEAFQRFDLVNAIRVPQGIFTYLGPLLVLPFSSRLEAVVGVLVAGRVLAWVAHLVLAGRAVPGLRAGFALRRAEVRPLLRLGGWMTVSNVLTPFLTYIDRFLIGAVLTVTAVTFYTTPYEVVTRLWIVPGALLSVFFPAFATVHARDRRKAGRLFDTASRGLFLSLFPACLVIVALAPEGLGLWLGEEFAARSSVVARWLAVGVFVNSLGHVPFAFLQGVGRPDVTGKLHLLEAPVYLLLLWFFTSRVGIAGAAFAWALRVTLDSAVLFAVAARVVPEVRSGALRMASWTAPALAAFGVAAWLPRGWLAASFLLLAAPCYLILVWTRLLRPEEEQWVRNLLPLRR